jgi:ribosome-associated protein
VHGAYGTGSKRTGLPLTSRDKALEIARLALDKKAADVIVLDVGSLVMYADYFVVCSGASTQQVEAIVENIERGLARRRKRPLGVEGRSHAHWVLMDYGDVIAHVFEKETREFYELEKLWLDAPRVPVDEGPDTLGREDKRSLSG